jgi:hypothetical protein
MFLHIEEQLLAYQFTDPGDQVLPWENPAPPALSISTPSATTSILKEIPKMA